MVYRSGNRPAARESRAHATASYIGKGIIGGGSASLAKLRAASIAAKGNNAQELPDSTLGATVSFSSTSDAALQPTVRMSDNPLIYKTSGKLFQRDNSTAFYAAHLSVAPRTNGNVKATAGANTTTPSLPANGADQSNNWVLRFKAAGLSTFEFDFPFDTTNQPLRMSVDGRYLNRDGIAVNWLSVGRYIKVAMPAGTHEVEIELPSYPLAVGFRLNAGATLVEPTRRPKAVGVGTSFEEALLIGKYTAGTFIKDAGGVDRFAPWDGLFQTFCKLNGYDFRNAALGGTGYTNNASTASKILDQMPYWINDDIYDLIFFGGPYNDKGLNVAQMRADARAAWTLARSAQPQAAIVVCGCCGGAIVTDDTSLTITAEAAIRAEFDAWKAATGETNAYFLPVSPNYANALIKNTNYQDWISTDTTHPYRGDATHGHVGIGYYLANLWRTQIGAM